MIINGITVVNGTSMSNETLAAVIAGGLNLVKEITEGFFAGARLFSHPVDSEKYIVAYAQKGNEMVVREQPISGWNWV